MDFSVSANIYSALIILSSSAVFLTETVSLFYSEGNPLNRRLSPEPQHLLILSPFYHAFSLEQCCLCLQYEVNAHSHL